MKALPVVSAGWCVLFTGVLSAWFTPALAATVAQLDLKAYSPECGIEVKESANRVVANWKTSEGTRCGMELSLSSDAPLIASIQIDGKTLAKDLSPAYLVTTGARIQRPGVKYIFFDKPVNGKNGPVRKFPSILDKKRARVQSAGNRVVLGIDSLSAGPFSGELEFEIYAGSPLVRIDAAMRTEATGLAYIYDATLDGDVDTVVWKDLADQFVREHPAGEPRAIAVRNRTIMAENQAGTLAVFPPPHAFFFPRDYTINFKFAQVGRGRFGLRQDPAGGAGHEGQFIPWFDAPTGRTQHMSFFLQLSTNRAEKALGEVTRYTHGDQLKLLEGFVTLGSHMHAALTVNEHTQHPRAPQFKKVFKGLNFQAFQLAEFHGDGHPKDPGPVRLNELKGMFELCNKYSDQTFLLLPSEEANAYFPGHSVLLFPKPVYLTLVPIAGAPFSEEVAGYGKVYHPQNAADLARVVRDEHGLAWTSHPRIKGSEGCPDQFKDEAWYRDDLWLGGTWKAMPGDLSETRLGVRSLDLLDDMNLWGQKKFIPGEIDCFVVDEAHEVYGHLNANYLRLARLPAQGDATPILDVLRRGEFFVTTGEVLIPSCRATADEVSVEVDWTFPLRQAELVICDGVKVNRRTIPLRNSRQFGRQTFHWKADVASARWFRVEVWDVAGNGAFTQPIYR